MAPSRTARGKKRAHDPVSDSDDDNVPSTSYVAATSIEVVAKVKKQRKAVTKKCPVCEEDIPVRLLDRHVDLEAERVEDIIRAIGSTEVLDMAEPDDGFTARTRKSAVKARKNMQPSSHSSDSFTLEIVDKSLRLVKRHRKQRHAKLRDMTRDDEDLEGLSGFKGGKGRWAGSNRGTLCPICMKMIPGDPDVVEAHVDACLAHEARMQDERIQEASARLRAEEEQMDDVDIGGDIRVLATDGASLRGLGFTLRDYGQQDVDDDIDVDGEDEVAFGVAQFSEGDVLNPLASSEDEDVEVEDVAGPSVPAGKGSGERDASTLDDLVTVGKVAKREVAKCNQVEQAMDMVDTGELDRAVETARESGNASALAEALEKKLSAIESTKVLPSALLLCRICLDPYTEPTVSTGCWHTCCRECWLRCLGSTRQCPICKRITAAADLRRVYL
ncbi:hypothetical protein BC835DRAFT_1326797 [Cytidiella melzeri]|nr:hypothetical protein BC835DRAFT_1326797 [Cytidiella melzeri]